MPIKSSQETLTQRMISITK